MQWLESGAQKLGFALTSQQLQQFRRYQQELLAWNRKFNLTAITEPADIEQFHFLDSLSVALALPDSVRATGRLCDVGSGAGFPGVPLKLLFPGIRLTLIDSTAKRARFLSALVAALGLENVEVRTGRCEDLAQDAQLRESFDAVVARAVAPLRVLAEYALPFCRLGGCGVFQKKGGIQAELAEAAQAWKELGGGHPVVKPIPQEVLGGDRVLVVVEKVSGTADRYPRRAGVPAKRPL
ncbi:MAG: 16S rRNA (guanine(527)-N(7))-methyltransferase RsmG [Dehalococcoidia bacterium]|nr:16S rRNA (guanine(527)-N(7))-methyltransferase RsmG [Dehalococcoidia bacterium]